MNSAAASSANSALTQSDWSDKWRAQGFSCELWVDPPGQCWEDFVHSTDELVVVLQGKVEFQIGDKVHHPAVGEELFIPKNTNHCVRNRGNTQARWLYGYGHRA